MPPPPPFFCLVALLCSLVTAHFVFSPQFIAMQPAFEKHCPKDRKNFLSYSYCLYKFFQLLGFEDYLNSFTLLKGRDKLHRQDQIFRKICVELNWEFVPSI